MNKYTGYLYLLCLLCQNGECQNGHVKEFHIPMPFTLEQYKIGLLYGIQVYSKEETGGNEGFEFVFNELFEGPVLSRQNVQGQYTRKTVMLASKVPMYIRLLAPEGSFELQEKSWNFFPTTYTTYGNPDYMKDGFYIFVTSEYKTGKCGDVPVVEVSEPDSAPRTLETINIATLKTPPDDYVEAYDPTKCTSPNTNIGPLSENWQDKAENVMCANKLVSHLFKWWGLQTKVESSIAKVLPRILVKVNRIIFCTRDKWMGMTMEDIRKMEAQTKDDLDTMRNEGAAKGMKILL